MTKLERVQLAMTMLNMLTDSPQSVEALAVRLGLPRTSLFFLFHKMKQGKLLSTLPGRSGGVIRKEGYKVTEEDVRKALNYVEDPIVFGKCKDCTGEFRRIKISNEAGVRFYVDEKDRKWAKGVCPDCLELVEKSCKKRYCRDCRVALPLTRYFKCYDCQPIDLDIDDDFIFIEEEIKKEDYPDETAAYKDDPSEEVEWFGNSSN